MNETSPATDLPASPPQPVPVASDFRLPLRATDYDAGLVSLLSAAINGAPRAGALAGLCAHLAQVLRLRLALLVRRTESGTLAIEATSAENDLWLELQRIPERADGGVSSRGPGASALRAGQAIHMRVGDEGFALWRAAAEGERVREIVAVPLAARDGAWALELFFETELARGATAGTVTVERLARSVESLMADLRLLEEQALVARALSSAGNAAFITDLEGTIVWSNPAFSALSGYGADEVRGRNPSLLRSGQQGLRYYRELWATIRAGKVWRGETVDRAKDGHEYAIAQTVSPVARDERVTHYVSIHQDIGRERRTRDLLERTTHLNPETGLLTRAAFRGAVEDACRDGQPALLAVMSLRGLQQAAPMLGEDFEGLVRTALGKRVREAMPAPDVAGAVAPFEYGLLLRGDVSPARVEARLRALGEKLAEPLPYLGAVPPLDVHVGTAAFPEQGKDFHELWLRADRQLADEPYARARRNAPH